MSLDQRQPNCPQTARNWGTPPPSPGLGEPKACCLRRQRSEGDNLPPMRVTHREYTGRKRGRRWLCPQGLVDEPPAAGSSLPAAGPGPAGRLRERGGAGGGAGRRQQRCPARPAGVALRRGLGPPLPPPRWRPRAPRGASRAAAGPCGGACAAELSDECQRPRGSTRG